MSTIKSYCTQNEGDCFTCSLVNYGKDCRSHPLHPLDASGNAQAVESGTIEPI